MANPTDTFHTLADKYVTIAPKTKYVEKHFIIKERDVGYRFYPHFHPYVGDLIHRLITKRVNGLQAADTQYRTTPAGSWEVLPGTTRAALSATTQVTRPDGSTVNVPTGVQVTLADGTQVTVTGAGNAALPGTLLVRATGGVGLTLADNSTTEVDRGETVTLVSATKLRIADVEEVTVPGGTQVALFGGLPRPVLHADIFSSTSYNPAAIVQKPYPVRDLDFTSSGAYSVYNWELFFHVPLTIAIHLSRNQRYEEALRWFHLTFDPTDDSEGPTPERFWKVKPFQFTDVKLIEELLVNLSSNADPVLRRQTINSIAAWKDNPFRPHVIARYRHSSFMFKTVMAYLDNLIEWGDSLFRQDTGEAIDEALQLYVLAASILGPRPQAVPKKGSVRPRTYANLRADLDAFGNVLAEVEPEIPFDLAPHPTPASEFDQFATLRSIGNSLYFGVPRNDKLMAYWDTVADRLFKIHNSLNLQGVFRQLALFEPPIDPAMLVKAAAAGLDIGAVTSGLNQPLPLVRFRLLVQYAAEIAQEVKSLGGALLSAMEKHDNEALAILRAQHERTILGLVEGVRYAQWQESIKVREGLEKSLASAAQRYIYYERQLGKDASEIAVPSLDAPDAAALLERLNFSAQEPAIEPRTIPIDIADGNTGGGKKINIHEAEELTKLEEAQDEQDDAALKERIGAMLGLIPNIGVHVQPFGPGGSVSFGGSNLTAGMNGWAGFARAEAQQLTYEATRSSRIGGYSVRDQERMFQSNVAAAEITQTFKQLRAAQIREAIAKREWENHKQQIENAKAVEAFLSDEKTGKRTNQALYAWLKREVRGIYTRAFQFAFDVARKAERALQHELGETAQSFLQFGYMSGREGLLAGEKLYLDVKRMQVAYHDLNRREYELTKSVSLLQLNPRALLELRTTGRATVTLPEELFDMDGPGHYFRRIRSISVSIPAVVGPYSSVNCTLRLLKSSVRRSALLADGVYERQGPEDNRFSDHFGSLEAVVTSSGLNDAGLFDGVVPDDRYLPFEYAGAISQWQLELPANPKNGDPQQFDYETISDVILHIRYTAREGGMLLRNGAVANLKQSIEAASALGSVRLFSVRHEFPAEWARFKAVAIAGDVERAGLSITLREQHYPFWSRGRLDAIRRVDLFARGGPANNAVSDRVDDAPPDEDPRQEDALANDAALGNLRVGRLSNIALPAPTGEFSLFFDDNSITDLWLALSWGKP